MNKFDKHIMVVPRGILFKDHSFHGFCHKDEHDFESNILKNFGFMRRGDAEEDDRFQQPIPYVILFNPQTKKVFAYKRASDTNYHESRLHGKWSWGVGGHVDKGEEDLDGNVLFNAMLREVKEEVSFNGNVNFSFLGMVNDDRSEVGKKHVGVLYLAETDATEAFPVDKEMAHGSFMSIEELEEVMRSPDTDVEGWSEIALEVIKNKIIS